jgi:hypothetical protein
MKKHWKNKKRHVNQKIKVSGKNLLVKNSKREKLKNKVP